MKEEVKKVRLKELARYSNLIDSNQVSVDPCGHILQLKSINVDNMEEPLLFSKTSVKTKLSTVKVPLEQGTLQERANRRATMKSTYIEMDKGIENRNRRINVSTQEIYTPQGSNFE